MSTLFDNYSFGILDASLFMTRYLTDELQKGLQQLRLYAAGETFTAELMEYESMLSGEKLAEYHFAADYINQNNAPYEEPQVADTLPLYDTWDLIEQMEQLRRPERFVVITGNDLLIQRIILHNVNADVFHLRLLRLYRHEDYPQYRQNLELWHSSRQPGRNAVRRRSLSPSVPLYSESGEPVRLDRKVGDGLESWLFRLAGRQKRIAKLYRDFSPEKLRNIQNLLRFSARRDMPWALFPESMVYYDPRRERPAGVVEPYMPGERNLGDDPLFAGNVDELSPQDLNRKLSETVAVCLMVTRQVCFLEHYGFFVSDFNIYNFARRLDGDSILMFDTDSFGYQNYFSGNQADMMTVRDYDKRTKTGVLDFCGEALYSFVFKLLSLGADAVHETWRVFYFDVDDFDFQQGIRFRRKLFPRRILAHMADVFRGKARPSAPVLLRLLSEEYARLQDDPRLDSTYAALLSPEGGAADIPGMEVDNMSGSDRPQTESGSQEDRRIPIRWNTRHANVRNSSKRLPIVFCLDVSPSMEFSENGNPSSMDLLNVSVRDFISQLSGNAKARASATISFVTFSTRIEEDLPFRSITEIEASPRTFVSVDEGGTCMANAVLQSIRKIEAQTEELSHSGISYYAPFLVMVTDGNPQENDNPMVIGQALTALKKHTASEDPADMIVPIVIGVGDQINREALLPYVQDFMPGPFHIRGSARNTRQAFETLFHALIKSVTDSLRSNGANQNLEAISAALEEAAHLVDTGSAAQPDEPTKVSDATVSPEDETSPDGDGGDFWDTIPEPVMTLPEIHSEPEQTEQAPEPVMTLPEIHSDPEQAEQAPELVMTLPEIHSDPEQTEQAPELVMTLPEIHSDPEQTERTAELVMPLPENRPRFQTGHRGEKPPRRPQTGHRGENLPRQHRNARNHGDVHSAQPTPPAPPDSQPRRQSALLSIALSPTAQKMLEHTTTLPAPPVREPVEAETPSIRLTDFQRSAPPVAPESVRRVDAPSESAGARQTEDTGFGGVELDFSQAIVWDPDEPLS